MKSILVNGLDPSEFESIIKSSVKEALQEMNPTNENNDQLLTQKEAARLLDVSTVTLWSWRNAEKIECKKIGKRVYYSKKSLLKFTV